MKEHVDPAGAVLLCGGRGTRLRELTRDELPKSLFTVLDKPLLQYSIESLPAENFNQLVLAVDYKADQIINWTQKASLSHDLKFSYQLEPGVLNAIKSGVSLLDYEEGNAICNTDEIRYGINMREALSAHRRNKTLCTIVTTHSTHLYRHGLISIRESDSRVTSLRLRAEEYRQNPEQVGLVYTGVMLMDKRATEYFDPNHDLDWMGIIDPLCDAGQISAYVDPSIYYFNVGTKEEYEDAVMTLGQKAA